MNLFDIKFIKRLLYLFLLAAFLGGCIEKKIVLPAPKKIVPPKPVQPTAKEEQKADPQKIKIVENAAVRVKVEFLEGVTKKPVRNIIKKCLAFLVQEFGRPIYRGNITLIITDNPADNGKMVWRDSRQTHRTIKLNDFNLDTRLDHVLVHELFHAFYQSNDFIKRNPNFITEGMAVYAEYKYRYREKTNKQILDLLRGYSDTTDDFPNTKGIDFDHPFGRYSDNQIDYYYALSGRIFFSQNPKNSSISKKIRNMLNKQPPKGAKFKDLVAYYKLDTSEDFLRKYTPLSPLPKPKKSNVVTVPSNEIKTKGEKGLSKKTGKMFYVQTIFTQKMRVAQNELDKLNKKGYNSAIIKKHKSGFIVIVGPYQGMGKAKKIIEKLINDGFDKESYPIPMDH